MRCFKRDGARLGLPVVVQKGAPLQFREWWPGVSMRAGVLGLPVPNGTACLTPQVLLVPLLGFDTMGYRGLGGGYFDRTLAALDPQPLKIGVGFELSRMSNMHPQPHDVPMDFIVTEAGVHRMETGGLVLVDGPQCSVPAARLERRRMRRRSVMRRTLKTTRLADDEFSRRTQ